MTPILGVIDSSKLKSSTAYESIANLVFAGSSTSTFSSIPQTYKHLQLRYRLISASRFAGFFIQFNGDTLTNYNWHCIEGSTNTVVATGLTSQNSIKVSSANDAAITAYSNVGIVNIIDYTNTNKKKTIHSMFGANDNTTGGSVSLNGGFWNSTTNITSLTFTAGATLNGTVSLYGIKG